MADDLIIDGAVMPAPKLEGVTVTRNKIWSKNTGRAANLQMVGDIKGIKDKVHIEFPPLSPSQTELLDDKVSNPAKPFVVVTLTNQYNKRQTLTVYFGDPSYKIYSYVKGKRYVTGVAIDGIER